MEHTNIGEQKTINGSKNLLESCTRFSSVKISAIEGMDVGEQSETPQSYQISTWWIAFRRQERSILPEIDETHSR